MEIAEKYKQTEVGLIPRDWELCFLGNLLIGITDVDHYMPKTEKYGVPYVMTGDLKDYAGDIDFDRCKKISYIDYEKLSKKIRNLKGDIILARYATVGTVSYVNIDFDFVVSYSCVTIKPDKSRLIDLYLYFYFKSHIFRIEVKNKVNANIQDNVGIGDLVKMQIPLPPTKVEQTAIASALSDSDALIRCLEKLITKKHNIKQGAMQKLLQPKKNWEVNKLCEIFNFYNTANYSKAEMTFDGEIGCLHYGLIHAIPNVSYSLKNGVKFYLKEDNTNYELIQDGDIVMVDASEDFLGINKCIEVSNVENRKFIAGLHTYLMRDVNNILMKNFRGLILNAAIVKQQLLKLAVGMKVYGVSKTQLKEVLIPFPPHEEQIRIATILSDMDAEIIALEIKLEKYKKVKLGMMQNLLTGKIRLK